MRSRTNLTTRSRLERLCASAVAVRQADLFGASPILAPSPHWSVAQPRDGRGRFMASERTPDGLDTATAVAGLSDPDQISAWGWGLP